MFFQKNQSRLDVVPDHIAIIMDGNGRWASRRMLNKNAGHKAGADTLEKITRYADQLGVRHLTVYAFSTENWKRPQEEVSGLMDLLRDYLDQYIEKTDRDNFKIDVVGDTLKLAPDIQDKIVLLEKLSGEKAGLNLHIALNYGGRDEMVRAFRKAAKEVQRGNLNPDAIEEATVQQFLDTSSIPDPDLLIRTSGETRLSNFLLWQMAYTELYFSKKLWPDFGEKDLLKAVQFYQSCDRRFGGR